MSAMSNRGGVGRTVWAVLLSLLTIVGGHFVNRRWDRALLFLVLIPLMVLAVYVWIFAALNMGFISRPSDVTGLFSRASRLPLYGFMVIYVLSVVTTYWDARAHAESFRPEWTATGRIAAVLASFTCFVLIAYTLFLMGISHQLHTTPSGKTKTSVPFGGPTLYTPSFWAYEVYGGQENENQLIAPPEGDGHLTLRFTYGGKPAAGIHFKLQLDSRYQSQGLVTDDQGLASLPLPVGTAYLNVLNITGVNHPPAGLTGIEIRTGHERKFSLGDYSKYPWVNTKGLALSVSRDPKAVAMTFHIMPEMEMLWPPRHSDKLKVRHDQGVIRWRPVAGAKTYLLTINSVKHEQDGTSYEEVVTRKVDGAASFSLAKLPVVKAGDGAHEYAVKVTAFDADGSYLTEVDDSFDTFVLADDMALAQENMISSARALSAQEHFGGPDGGMHPPAPPKGKGHLNLRFTYAGRPAAGVTFNLQLDGKYKTRNLFTDDQGMASLPLPVGKADLNELDLVDWAQAPAGLTDIELRTGHEQKFSLNGYAKYPWGGTNGLALSVSRDPKAVAMTVQIVPMIRMLWPLQDHVEAAVRHDQGVIRWSPVSGAKSYLLTIMEVKRDGTITSYPTAVTRKVVGASSFALAKLPVVKSDHGTHEYAASVAAFAGDGSYLSGSGRPFFNGSFVLADHMALAEDRYRAGDGGAFSGTSYEQRRKDGQRLDASFGLIQDGQYDLATRLLATVSKASRKGEWNALQGWILAKQQRCDQAEPFLKQAATFGDCDCGLDQARKLCPGK